MSSKFNVLKEYDKVVEMFSCETRIFVGLWKSRLGFFFSYLPHTKNVENILHHVRLARIKLEIVQTF